VAGDIVALADSWRSHLFVPGKAYLVLKDWSERGSTFKAGTVVKYERCGYERYDNEAMFLFVQGRGFFRRKANLIWRIRDEEPDSAAREYFREADPQ
jgi:hypothetical protein